MFTILRKIFGFKDDRKEDALALVMALDFDTPEQKGIVISKVSTAATELDYDVISTIRDQPAALRSFLLDKFLGFKSTGPPTRQSIGPYTRQLLESNGLRINGRFSNFSHPKREVLFALNDKNSPVVLKHILHEEEKTLSELLPYAPKDLAIVRGDIVKYDSKTFLLMPMYSATTEHYRSLIPLPPSELLLREGRRIKVVLDYVHEKGYVHMDVKPANIFFDQVGDWFLGDFGSAVLEGEVIKTTTPEFLPDRKPTVAHRSLDFFMLGVTLLLFTVRLDNPILQPAQPITKWIQQSLHKIDDPNLLQFIMELIESSNNNNPSSP